MKKLTFVLMAICCLAVSCKQDTPEEKKLKEQLAASVDGSELGIDLKYKLISIHFVDTIYYGDTIKDVIGKLENIWIEPTKEMMEAGGNFVRKYLNKKYEYIAFSYDSLYKNFDSIQKYNVDWLETFYSFRYYSDIALGDYYYETNRAKEIIDHIDLIRKTSAAYDEMKLHAPNEIYGYRLKHEYKIFNPLLKCEQTLSEIITVNSKLEIL
ncbi:MAG: hypothetical protein MJZ59_00530 [Paludibacteraceae bacterium]|nr:hypothetical protein [Paludibacteraceae bacterium]